MGELILLFLVAVAAINTAIFLRLVRQERHDRAVIERRLRELR
jgi:hypothetical protein